MQLTLRRRLADRVWQWRKTTYAASTALVALVAAFVFLSISHPATMVQVSTEPTFFDANRSFRAVEELARLYPNRTIGSADAAGSVAWLTESLSTLGIDSDTQTFAATLGVSEQTLRNVSVVLPGQTREAILVSAPRDPDPMSRRSGPTEASGTGVLLELIQVFAARPHEKTLVFLSTEGAAHGGLGLAHFLQNDPRGPDVRTVLSVRSLGGEGHTHLTAAVIGPQTATAGWLVRLATEGLQDAGLRLRLPNLFGQVASQALSLWAGEQVAGLREGIPSLALSDPAQGTVNPLGLGTQGAAVERLVLSLDAGEFPPSPATAVVLDTGRFMTTRALEILGLLMLLPSLAMAGTWLGVTSIRPDGWMRYLRNLVSFVLPLAALAVAAWLFGVLGLIPRYPHQAPTTAEATQPRFLVALALLVLGLTLLFLSRHFLGYLRPREPLVMAEIGKLSLGLIVLAAGLMLLVSHSPFSLLTAVTAAWLWPLSTCFAEPKPWDAVWRPRLRSNRLLLLAGMTAPLALYLYLVLATPVGWGQGWWFLLVQAVSGAYGIKGPAAFVLITTGFLTLLGVRRLQLLPMETLEDEDDLALVAAPPPRTRGGQGKHRRAPAERGYR